MTMAFSSLFRRSQAAKDDVEPASTQRNAVERTLVFRLDCFLMVFGCISQIIKYLDQVSLVRTAVMLKLR